MVPDLYQVEVEALPGNGPGQPQAAKPFRVLGGALDPSVLVYIADVATNAAFYEPQLGGTNAVPLQAFATEACSVVSNMVNHFNLRVPETKHGTKGSWYAFERDLVGAWEYSYIFSSPTGVVLHASLVSTAVSETPLPYELQFFDDGVLQAIVHGHEGLGFHHSGRPAFYYNL